MNAQTQQSVRFVVTGFGPFRDSKENPTTAIAERLVDYLHEKGEHDIAVSTSSMVVEVSLEAARQQVDAIFEEIWSTNSIGHLCRQIVVLLHLGVNYRGENFQLESFAYNDADFRIPDERQYQPKREPIIEGVALGEPLRTHFDVPPLVQELNRSRCNDCNATKAMISTDPVACETEQLDFVVDLMVALKRQVGCDQTMENGKRCHASDRRGT